MRGQDPWTSEDPLGEALHFLRMTGAFYARSELSEPWGFAMPEMEDCLWFHVVTSGRCRLEVSGAPPRYLVPGEFALVPTRGVQAPQQAVQRIRHRPDLVYDPGLKRREVIDTRNHADALLYSTERALSEHGAKVDAETRKAIEDAVNDLKDALKGTDDERIKKTAEALAKASMKLGEAIYKKADTAAPGDGGAGPKDKPGGDNVVDGEFKPDDEKK